MSEELDRAAEEASQSEETQTVDATVETEEQEAVETPETVAARDEENAERSRLGRKVKELESQLGEIGALREQLQQFMQSRQSVAEEDEEIITSKTLETYLSRQEAKKSEQKQTYEKNYTSTFAKIGTDDDNFDAVWKEMVENHNVIHTGDPTVDAKLNYLSAQNALLKKPKNPVQGKGKDVKGVNVPDTTKTTPKSMPKLDPVAQEFVDRMKLPADWVNEKLESK